MQFLALVNEWNGIIYFLAKIVKSGICFLADHQLKTTVNNQLQKHTNQHVSHCSVTGKSFFIPATTYEVFSQAQKTVQ
jgi:hypothetical protein